MLNVKKAKKYLIILKMGCKKTMLKRCKVVNVQRAISTIGNFRGYATNYYVWNVKIYHYHVSAHGILKIEMVQRHCLSGSTGLARGHIIHGHESLYSAIFLSLPVCLAEGARLLLTAKVGDVRSLGLRGWAATVLQGWGGQHDGEHSQGDDHTARHKARPQDHLGPRGHAVGEVKQK